MKRTLSTLLAVISLVSLSSQTIAKRNICRNVKESKDAFTNEPTKSARLGITDGKGYWELFIEKKGDKYFLTVDAYSYTINQTSIPAGEKMLIKLQNEKLIELELTTECKPKFYGGRSTIWSVKQEVDLKIIRRLSHSLIAAMKVNVQGTEVSLTTNPDKPKAMEAIMDAASCIAGESEEATK